MNVLQKQIVIIGGGFAGLQIAKYLANSHFKILLIDKKNYHQFQPLFYQVASAGLEPSSISFPFRKIFQGVKNIEILWDEVIEIQPESNSIKTNAHSITYEKLIIASGCTTNYFGNEKIKSFSLPMKTTEEAIVIRNRVLSSFEEYTHATEEEKEYLNNIVIVGAGPTGVELSGSFAEMRDTILPKDYPHTDFSNIKIILIEGSPNTLNSMSDASRKNARLYLEKLGVLVKTETVVKDYDGKTIVLNTGETILCKNLIWAAGVSGNIIKGLPQDTLQKNRYLVNRFNQIKGFNNIYALGDVALMITPKYPYGHPQVANVAINQGKNLAKNLINAAQEKPLIEYEYNDLGSMATIGKNKAVVEMFNVKIQGRIAWYIWMFLHLMLILSVRNKIIVFINWAWSYFITDSSLRLIFSAKEKK